MHQESQPFVAASPQMQDVLAAAHRAAADSQLGILIEGPTGTGKTVLARHIHERSDRRGKPHRIISCATLSENLAESELFGHRKGAFTGATSDKHGRLSLCDGGTCTLDDVAGLSVPLQAKLFQFLDDRTFTPLGDTRILTADVRVIATSSVPLKAEVAAGRFRIDLFHRLRGLRIFIPPLARRPEDIRAIAQAWLLRFGFPMRFDAAAWNEILSYSWPGNIRELENLLKSLGTLGRALITAGDVVSGLRDEEDWTVPAAPAPQLGYHEAIEEYERKLITGAINDSNGCRSLAARRLGLPKSTLLGCLRRLGLEAIGRSEIRPCVRKSERGDEAPRVSTEP